jgi:hypothetical protein
MSTGYEPVTEQNVADCLRGIEVSLEFFKREEELVIIRKTQEMEVWIISNEDSRVLIEPMKQWGTSID